MYGYVLPRKGELLVRELEQYQAAYCGLCDTLGRRYGLAARFLVNYDLTFLYCLLTGCLPPRPLEKKRCPANPFVKKTCVAADEALDYTADACVLLGWYKLRDASRDEGLLKRMGAGLACGLLKRSFRKAKHYRPELEKLIKARLELLTQLETDQSEEMDRAADAFAGILQACADFLPEEDRRPAGQVLYHTGRFLYLCDAWDDLKEDRKQGRYNPVASRFRLEGETLSSQQQEQLQTTISHSIRLAAAALELLELQGGKGLLENIIYLGLPAVLSGVADGTFHTKKQRSAYERSL